MLADEDPPSEETVEQASAPWWSKGPSSDGVDETTDETSDVHAGVAEAGSVIA